MLGQLVKDGNFPWWLSVIEVSGSPITLSVGTDTELTPQVLDAAARCVQMVRTNETRYRTQIATDLKAHVGKDAVVPDTDLAGYLNHMTLESVTYSDDGSLQLDYADGGLFGGHLMIGFFSVDGRLESTDIAG